MSLVIEDGARFGDSVLVCIIMQFPGMSSRLSSDGNTVFDFVTFLSWRLILRWCWSYRSGVGLLLDTPAGDDFHQIHIFIFLIAF